MTIYVSGFVARFQHAATAIVNVASGRVVLVPDSMPDALTRTWLTRFPNLFTHPAALRAGLREQFPPARDGARARAATFGRFGWRGETTVTRHVPDDDGADSALAGTPAPLIVLPSAGASALVLPLVDQAALVRGVFVALGGAHQRTLWLPLAAPASPWGVSLDRLRASDTLPAARLVRGHARAIPVRNQLVIVQPRYEWTGAAPRLLYVSALRGDSVARAPSLAQLAGREAGVRRPTADLRARIRELYDEMRLAAARGDWSRYGRAFDAIGALVGRPPR